ncbi:MAG TPA: hypothetical protein EYG73_01420 [Arcobacter sp.]|nr:hypothetical protein [Arcobacter sp.]
MKLIVNTLLEKQILKLSNIEDSFFLYKKLDKRVKLNQNIISLNYSNESPYPANMSVITSIMNENNLYLWFIKKDSHRYIPEAYVVFRRLLLEYQDLVFIVRGELNKVVLIKNGILISSFSKSNISTTDIVLIKEEYSLDEVVILKEEEYTKYLDESLHFLRISDLLDILDIKIDFKEFFLKSIHFLALPLLISSIIITLIVGGYSFYLDTEKEKLHHIYKKNQTLNREIKNSIDKNEEENMIYMNLINEFKYVDKSMALSKIIQVTEDMNMSMYYIKIYENRVDFIIKTENNNKVPTYIKKLFESNLFQDVKNINTRKLRNSVIEITMNAKLKVI